MIKSIELQDIQAFSRNQNHQILGGISGIFSSGKMYVIRGDSGSGKSVWMRSFLQYPYDPVEYQGRIQFNFQDGRAVPISLKLGGVQPMPCQVIYLPQDTQNALHPLKRMQDQFAPQLSKEAIIGFCQQSGIHHPIQLLKQYAHELSGGEAQRFCVAIALSYQPDVLLMDEISANIDLKVSRELHVMLRKYIQDRGGIGICISHYPEEEGIQVDETYCIREGKGFFPFHSGHKQVSKDINSAQTNVPQLLLEVNDLAFQYPKQKHPLWSGLNWKIFKPSFIAVAGASGAGKSTLFDVLMGELEPSNGVIHYPQKTRPRLSWIPQDIIGGMNPVLTIRENILENARTLAKDPKRFMELCIICKLDEQLLSMKPYALSGGQLQRASLVRALISDPDLLICDEPTAALPPELAQEILNQLKKIAYLCNIAVVTISHQVHLLEIFDSVYELTSDQLQQVES